MHVKAAMQRGGRLRVAILWSGGHSSSVAGRRGGAGYVAAMLRGEKAAWLRASGCGRRCSLGVVRRYTRAERERCIGKVMRQCSGGGAAMQQDHRTAWRRCNTRLARAATPRGGD